MYEQKWHVAKHFGYSSCKWLYAGATMVGLSAGMMLTGIVASANSAPAGDSESTPQTQVASANQAASATPATPASSSEDKRAGADNQQSDENNTDQLVNGEVPDKDSSLSKGSDLSKETDQPTDPAKPGTQSGKLPSSNFRSRIAAPAATKETPADMAVTAAPVVTATVQPQLAYQLNDAGSGYILTGYTDKATAAASTATSLVIPDFYQGKPVTVVGTNAFKGAGLTAVTFGKNLQWIEAGAFENNLLKSIKLPDGVWSVGESAFAHNQLTTVDLNQVSAINAYAFSDNAITSLTIPDNVTGIAAYAFQNNAMTKLALNQKVVSIGSGAFQNNQIQGQLVLPDTLTLLGVQAFENNQLTGVTLDSGLTMLNTGVFANNQLTGTLVLPATITSVGDQAFTNNQLTDVQLNDNLTSIGTAAFAHNLIEKSLTLPSKLINLGDEAFWDNRLTGITLNDQLTGIGSKTFADNQLKGTLNLPANILNIGTQAFANNHLTGLTGGANLQTIEKEAFLDNDLTGSFTLSDQLKSIGESAFANNQLTQILGGAGLTTIEVNAFVNNELSGVLNLSNVLKSIGKSAFANNQLTGLTGGASLDTINDQAFANNQLQGTLTLADTLHDVGEYAFAHNDLTKLDLGDAVNSLADYSFAYNNLKEINASGKINTIGDYAFAGQRDLDDVKVDALVTNNGQTNTAVYHVREAIMKRLGLSNLDLAGLSFTDTDTQQMLNYDAATDTLTLPVGFIGGTITVSLSTDSTDTGRYGVKNLTLVLNRYVIADVDIPSNLKDEGMGEWLVEIHADKVKDAAGYVGNIISVKVPVLEGWTVNKASIKATVNPDGTITPNEAVIYTSKVATKGEPTTPTGGDTGHTGDDSGTPTTPIDGGQTGDTGTTPVDSGETPNVGVVTDEPTIQVPIVIDDHKAAKITPVLYVPDWQHHQMGRPIDTEWLGQRVPQQWRASVKPIGTYPKNSVAAFKPMMAPAPTETISTTTQPARQAATISKQVTLPQTSEQLGWWQALGVALLSTLSWLGLTKRKHES
ncbi:leucine-rich repeat domain-containing protein [Levilactobacillus tongjiangensis]|uniref:Leucine-rich repeat domain-containing protein n=1 Tax=Levilactobacillus tongjiangensis TaxID=2486023 RepID=A0ABW1SU06_9LACO|nr:leucine-rich repeat domain-containing protein [Levilactobacillus tongjiangensis]